MKRFMLSVLLVLGTYGLHAQDRQPDLGTEAQREAGQVLYNDKCAHCHGEAGDAASAATPYLRPAPRDFTSATFKFRTSASGELPTDEDLKRSIREGMPYTSMPAWGGILSEQQITNLAYYIKTFSDDFAGPYGVVDPIEIPRAPSFSEASAERGRVVYEENQCLDCHGNQGRGDGNSAPTLEDQWIQPIRPADLTKRWTFRNGSTREDIYRTFTTGLDGSPMPSYELSPEESWALVDYVWSLSRDEPNYATVVVAQGVEGDLDLSQGAALFEGATPAYFPVVGQIIEPGRAFHPGVNGIEVQAVYNQEEIAFLLSWHDMSAETVGMNDPSITLPIFDPSVPDTLGTFSDAVAVQLPSEMPAGIEKPYFMFGDRSNAVDLWFADLAGSGATSYIGQGSSDITPGNADLSMTSSYNEGAWTVLFKRARTLEEGLSFEEGTFVPIAFSVWDGFNRERGNKRGLTSWYHVYLEPLERESAALPMVQYGLMTLLLELGLIFFVRRKYKNQEVA